MPHFICKNRNADDLVYKTGFSAVFYESALFVVMQLFV